MITAETASATVEKANVAAREIVVENANLLHQALVVYVERNSVRQIVRGEHAKDQEVLILGKKTMTTALHMIWA